MRERIWRRALAVLALVIGVGLAGPATHSNAATVDPATASPTHAVHLDGDWWW